jgi:hypothetical protein
MRESDFTPGRIFVVPLLGGGYAFGYLTWSKKGSLRLVNIFDYVSEDPAPPADLLQKPIAIYDMFVGAEFLLTPKHKAGKRWTLTKDVVPGNITPRNRYYRMGAAPWGFKRVDMLGEEPDLPLSPEEAKQYPSQGQSLPPVPTAQIEIKLKRLDVAPLDFVRSWRSRMDGSEDSKSTGFAPGRVFVVPLLGGGYAFGYATALYEASMFANILDHISDSDSPPSAPEEYPVALYDLQIGADFAISDPSRGGESWRWCDVAVPGPVAPRNR